MNHIVKLFQSFAVDTNIYFTVVCVGLRLPCSSLSLTHSCSLTRSLSQRSIYNDAFLIEFSSICFVSRTFVLDIVTDFADSVCISSSSFFFSFFRFILAIVSYLAHETGTLK